MAAGELRGHEAAVSRVAWLPDSRGAVTAGRDGEAILWNIRAGVPLRRFHHGDRAVKALAVAPDGAHVATGDDAGRVAVWELK